VLHWLLPWQVPAYDKLVRVALGVPDWEQPRAYRAVAGKLLTLAADLETDDRHWIGVLEPHSPLRALDKCLWWAGGGGTAGAAVVKDPWQVVRTLGLEQVEDV
jgi:hypothetical protein